MTSPKPVCGAALNFADSPTPTFKYLLLPVVDLSIGFLYAFENPIETVWMKGRVSAFENMEDSLRKFASDKWHEAFKDLVSGGHVSIPTSFILKEHQIVPK